MAIKRPLRPTARPPARRDLVHDLGQRFRTLSRLKDRQKRGFAFQDLVQDLFRRCGFAVEPNPRGARPRQTDLHVKHRDLELLVEVRWRDREMDSADMDALLARLQRTPPGIIGCAFSTAGVNRSAAQVIEEKRTQREIVAFAADEVFAVFEGRVNILDLINRKRAALRRDGRAWFTPPAEADLPRSWLLDLPPARDRVAGDGQAHRAFFSPTQDRGAFVYAKTIPETRYNGPDAALRIDIPNGTIKDLANVLHSLNTSFSLDGDAMFTIHQTGAIWTGFGARNLLTELPRWQRRYASIGLKDAHYSEELILFSPCSVGWALVTAQHITHSGTYHHGYVELGLPGIPVDTTPYKSFCDALGASCAFFTAPAESDHRRAHFYRGKAPRLKVRRLVLDRHDGSDWVTGLIAENPFRGDLSGLRNETDLREILHDLHAPEEIYVDLTHHHLAQDVVDYYEVTGVEALTLATRPVVRVTAEWNRLLKSTWQEQRRSAPSAPDWTTAVMRAARSARTRSKRTGRFVSKADPPGKQRR